MNNLLAWRLLHLRVVAFLDDSHFVSQNVAAVEKMSGYVIIYFKVARVRLYFV